MASTRPVRGHPGRALSAWTFRLFAFGLATDTCQPSGRRSLPQAIRESADLLVLYRLAVLIQKCDHVEIARAVPQADPDQDHRGNHGHGYAHADREHSQPTRPEVGGVVVLACGISRFHGCSGCTGQFGVHVGRSIARTDQTEQNQENDDHTDHGGPVV